MANQNAEAGFAAAHGSATLGEFTKANGTVRQCRAIERRGDVLKVQYVERGKTFVGYIGFNEFRAASPNDQAQRPGHRDAGQT